MAQARREDSDSHDQNRKDNAAAPEFKFNAAAPEFVPRSHLLQPTPIIYPYYDHHYNNNHNHNNNVDASTNNGSWIYIADQQTTVVPLAFDTKPAASTPPHNHHHGNEQIAISDELKKKIIEQAEYMFSDMSMLLNESFTKHVNKDPEGFVPVNFITTTKKLKSLNVTNQMVSQALRFGSNLLVLSSDGKKVRRKYPFTDKEKEDFQLRTVIAENLPDDHSHQSIAKLFDVVGSIKSIRVCQPQDSGSSRSFKGDSVFFSNKLHALVEFENSETAEKAAEKLNDERYWRKGLRVRVMLKPSPKSVLKSWKSAFDVYSDDDEHEDVSSPISAHSDENSKNSWFKNRGKAKSRPILQSVRSLLSSSSTLSSSELCVGPAAKGPRTPDGTRGFTMGRGKALSVPVRSG